MSARTSQGASVARGRQPLALGEEARGEGRPEAAGNRPGVPSRSRRLAAWSGVLAVAAVSAIQVAPASAAAPLQPRPTAAEPPTDRVLEQVSPADKGGNSIRHVWRVAESEDGGVLFSAMGPFADVRASTTNTFYRARRGVHGWQTVGLQPPPLDGVLFNSSTFQYFDGADAQLDAAVIHTQYPYVQEAVRPNGLIRNNVYRAGADGAFSWLSSAAFAANGVLEHAHVAAVSPAGQVLVIGTTASTGGNGGRLYVRDGERTVPVDVHPDGTPVSGNASPVGDTPMSDDGQTVAFGGDGGWYVRRDALRASASTVDPNRSRRSGDPAGTECPSLGFVAMSADGRRILVTCGTPLTDDAPANGTGLYEYDPVDDDLRYRFPFDGPTRVLGADRDLRRIHMAGSGGSLWLVDDRGVREVASDALATTEAWTSVSRDGKRLAFISDKGLDGGYAGRQMYVFDATDGPDGSLTCVSCRPGASAGGQALFGTGDIPDPSLRDAAMRESFATDGSFYFMSTAALTPEAPDGPASVYEYRDGQVRLMVAGSAEGDARFAGTSPEGTDVFVLTKRSLLPQDDDGAVQDLYSLRRGGGFPPDPECSGCRPPAPEDRGAPRAGLPVVSEQETSPDRGARSVAPVASAKPSVVGRKARGATARLRVRVRGAGTLRVTGSGARGVSRRVTKAGTYTVTVRLSAYGRRVLERRGRLPLRLTVRLAPKNGIGGSTRTTLTIKKKTTRKAA